MKKLIVFGMLGISALALLSVIVAVVLAVSLSSDVDVLSKRTRDMVRAQKALREDVALLRETIEEQKVQMARAEPVTAPDGQVAAQPDAAPALAAAPIAAGVARPVKVNAVAECEFRGDTSALADCIRQQNAAGGVRHLGDFRANARKYR